MILTWILKLKLKLFFSVIGSMAFILVIFTSHAADPTFNQTKQEYYLDKIILDRSESHLESV